jgi:hypothetical protein
MSAANEINPELGLTEYQEPDPSKLKRIARDDHLGRTALEAANRRINRIEVGDVVVYEKRQPGVTRYPAPKVYLPPETPDLYDVNSPTF